MNLDRMLSKCMKEQWESGDIDWTIPSRPMTQEEETAIVQCFTDMAGIERLAGWLFHEQWKRAEDPRLKAIFETFVQDELRHAHVAQMLADHYDIHRYQLYAMNPALVKFAPHFVRAIQFLSPEIANLYITTGELILDVGLLRSINDYVHDGMSDAAMKLINRDESRHIAIDYYMTEYYSSQEYAEKLKEERGLNPIQTIKAYWAFANVFRHARPFFKGVFFDTMDIVDPSGNRLLEAFKRIQLLAAKERVAERPFNKFLLRLQRMHNNPLGRIILGRVIVRLLGVDARVLEVLYTTGEFERAKTMSFDAMAAEALSAKLAH